MRLFSASIRQRASGVLAGLVAGVVLTGVVVANPSDDDSDTRAGGSLPLKDSELESGDGADPNGYAMATGSQWNVLNWGPGALAGVVSSYSMNTVDDAGRTVKKVFVGTQANPDVGGADSVNNMSFSDDSGKTFLTTKRNFPLTPLNMTRLSNGTLIGIEFIPEWTDDTQKTIYLKTWKSTDNGETWNLTKGEFTASPGRTIGPMNRGLRVHRRPIELPDGTIIVPAYTVFKETSPRWTSIVLQSTDEGRSWTMRSEIPAPDAGTAQRPGTNEVGWTYVADGRLMAVMRATEVPQGEGEGALAYLWQSYSSDNGMTWTEAKIMKAPGGEPLNGIYPDPVLLPNGILLLATGRKDVRTLASYDGTGTKWDEVETVFVNYPSEGFNGRFDGTSGNTSIEAVGSNRAIHFYDQCHMWGCGAYNQQFGVSAEYVGAVTPGTGRIDVAGKVVDGSASVTGAFAPPSKVYPEQRPEGAFDGSSERGAEAVLQRSGGGPSQMIVKLDRAYPINKIGLMLGHGEQQSAQVSLSEDGNTWTAPVVNAVNRTDRALRYTDIDETTARYVRVQALTTKPLTVTELEVYAAGIDTFENELPFAVPRGWSDAFGSWVTDVPDNEAYSDIGGFHSATALRLWDKWTDQEATISKSVTAGETLESSFQWATTDTRAPFILQVKGTDGDDQATPWAFRLVNGARPTDPLVVQVRAGAEWKPLGSLPRVIPARSYVNMSLTAAPGEVTLTVDGKEFTATTPNATVDTLNQLTFTTGDPVDYGGIYYLDDVTLRTS